MTEKFLTEQEQFWAGEFGDEYTNRNQGKQWIAANLSLFAQVLRRTERVQSVLEFGANIGLNLDAIHQLLPHAELSAVEINAKAAELLTAKGFINVWQGSILEYKTEKQHDLTFTKGVLIHLNPDWLPKVYDALYHASSRYILIAEYYNPKPVEVAYRGHSEKLYKRDFCGELLDRFSDLSLIDYGFVYHRDMNFPEDDLTWFLLEKKQRGMK